MNRRKTENLRYAAALALVGWYLLLPPHGSVKMVTENDGVVTWAYIKPAPLARWSIYGGFDKASECFQEESTLRAQGANLVNSKDKVWSKRAAELFAAQCIATDDPRLKGN